MLLAILPGNGGASAAQAAPPGQIGATSKGSVTIRVSVRPQVLLLRAAAENSGPDAIKVATASAERICLLASETSGNYAVLLQAADSQSGVDRTAILTKSEAATSACGSAGRAGASRITGFRLPTADPGRPYTLLIAPE